MERTILTEDLAQSDDIWVGEACKKPNFTECDTLVPACVAPPYPFNRDNFTCTLIPCPDNGSEGACAQWPEDGEAVHANGVFS